MPQRPIEWPTVILLAATYVVWATGTLLWSVQPVLAVILTGVAIAQFSSLQHEVLHGHPFDDQRLNEALVFPGLTLTIPYRRFRDTHLAHHHDPILTDPFDDPESNYLAPEMWHRLPAWGQRLLRWNNTLLGRVVIGPILGNALFVAKDFAAIRKGDRVIRADWALHLCGVALVLGWLWLATDMGFGGYVIAAYLGHALLKIRTFLEHRAHEVFRGRTVVVEDRGPLSLLYLNNNFHVVHHMHPSVPWYRLPALYAARKAHYLRRNDGYVYRSYAEVISLYLTKAKDPVPHPIWPVKRSDGVEDQPVGRH
jgi:fatty acid desaturase